MSKVKALRIRLTADIEQDNGAIRHITHSYSLRVPEEFGATECEVSFIKESNLLISNVTRKLDASVFPPLLPTEVG